MAREEFKKVKRIKTFREGDDYYYSLKENQYSIGVKVFEKDVINSIHISNRERKERIYSQKYVKNLEYLEGYLMVTKNLTEFILETEINGVTGEEEEAIILDSFTEVSEPILSNTEKKQQNTNKDINRIEEVEDSLLNNETPPGSDILKSFINDSDSSKLNQDATPNANSKAEGVKSFKTLNTYELSEDEKSQAQARSRRMQKIKELENRRKSTTIEVDIDEDEEEEEEDEASQKAASPRSRYGWKHQNEKHRKAEAKGVKRHTSSDIERKSSKSSSETPLNKLSRKPNKKSTEKVDDNLGAPIEMSELDSSGNSISPQVAYRSEDNREEEKLGAKSIEEKMRKKKESLLYEMSYPTNLNPEIVSALPKKLNQCNQQQKEILLDAYVQDFISDEISL